MNDTRLQIYLDDHLALMVGELELAARCQKSNRKTPLGEFLERLHTEVQSQRSIARDVLHRMGGKASPIKNGVAWMAEKLGRLKLNDSLLSYSELSRLIELESLAAAATERISLWDTLENLAPLDGRFEGISYGFFRDQSEQQLKEIQTRRRYASSQAFST